MVVDAAETAPSLPYHEPAVVAILVQASFLLALNIINAVLDRIVYCGLLGQVLIGIAWGTPGAKWLSINVEEVITQLGYLGLILLVYQGGLSTSFKALKANLLLSSAVAITGIGVPIALSYSLQGLLTATPLQAFAAGAALCSTSLGTTFTVLASSGLSSSRLGVVLTSAAMMDDVVGLVMVQVISNLGGGISAVTVVRPILVSLAFATIVPLSCRFLVKPLTISFNHVRKSRPDGKLSKTLCLPHAAFTIHTALLIALVAGSSYAGTSNLFAAYIAGAVISWWDSEVPHPDPHSTTPAKEKANPEQPDAGLCEDQMQPHQGSRQDIERERSSVVRPDEESSTRTQREECSGTALYERYYQQAVTRLLQPFFFASIGFSIPITRMFNGSIVWRGFVYTVLMIFGKLVCGLWLVRFPLTPVKEVFRAAQSRLRLPFVPHLWGKDGKGRSSTLANTGRGSARATSSSPSSDPVNTVSVPHTSTAPKPFSLHPPLILALAMTARGEIGFLISAVAESNGVFASPTDASSSESDIFLVVTWAIVLCTIIGPLGVGLSVRRVKMLEARKNGEQEGSGRHALGVWGVE